MPRTKRATASRSRSAARGGTHRRSMDWSSYRVRCRSGRLSISRSRRQVRTTCGRILPARAPSVLWRREDGVDAFQQLALERRPDWKDADRGRGCQWPRSLEQHPLVGISADPRFQARFQYLHAGSYVGIDVGRFRHLEWLADAELVPVWPTPRKHRHDQRPGVPRDANRARWQGRLATKEGHWHPVLEKIVVDDKPGNLSPSQSADDAAHATGSRLDHRHQVRVTEVGDTIEHEARSGPAGNDRHRHPLRGYGVPEQVECTHVRGGHDDALSTSVCVVQDGEILDRDWHQFHQLLWREMF